MFLLVRSDLFGFDMTFNGDAISEAARYQHRLVEHRQLKAQEAQDRARAQEMAERKEQIDAMAESAGRELRILALTARIGRWWWAKARSSSVLRRASLPDGCYSLRIRPVLTPTPGAKPRRQLQMRKLIEAAELELFRPKHRSSSRSHHRVTIVEPASDDGDDAPIPGGDAEPGNAFGDYPDPAKSRASDLGSFPEEPLAIQLGACHLRCRPRGADIAFHSGWA